MEIKLEKNEVYNAVRSGKLKRYNPFKTDGDLEVITVTNGLTFIGQIKVVVSISQRRDGILERYYTEEGICIDQCYRRPESDDYQEGKELLQELNLWREIGANGKTNTSKML